MLEDSKLYYTEGNKVIMRTSNGDLDVTRGFPREHYEELQERKNTQKYSELVEMERKIGKPIGTLSGPRGTFFVGDNGLGGLM